MTPKTAVIYYSATGTTYRLAQAIEAGAKEAGEETKLLKVQELTLPLRLPKNSKRRFPAEKFAMWQATNAPALICKGFGCGY